MRVPAIISVSDMLPLAKLGLTVGVYCRAEVVPAGNTLPKPRHAAHLLAVDLQAADRDTVQVEGNDREFRDPPCNPLPLCEIDVSVI